VFLSIGSWRLTLNDCTFRSIVDNFGVRNRKKDYGCSIVNRRSETMNQRWPCFQFRPVQPGGCLRRNRVLLSGIPGLETMSSK
jgi:hypothetical protein